MLNLLVRLDESLCSSRQLDAEHCAIQFQQDLGFHMLSCGRNDLVREAIPLLGKLGVNSFNMQVSHTSSRLSLESLVIFAASCCHFCGHRLKESHVCMLYM